MLQKEEEKTAHQRKMQQQLAVHHTVNVSGDIAVYPSSI
jgi:hypothetical protein